MFSEQLHFFLKSMNRNFNEMVNKFNRIFNIYLFKLCAVNTAGHFVPFFTWLLVKKKWKRRNLPGKKII